ncbi:MAG: toprim domain-containing protein [Eubacteriales bacterium]|nr:toprim domain-containing protein [Eubacteriales bacterium]
MPKNKKYDNESISALKGADRVRLRPSVIFGSDDLNGCKHSFFEILSNSIDEAREGYGSVITVTRFADNSLEVIDEGRGIPLDYNPKEERYNWELVYCELYAGGKYNNLESGNYQYSLGLNGLGACATQYASEYFEVSVYRDGFHYELSFEKGKNIGGLKKTAYKGSKRGSRQKWRPDRDVFTEIIIPLDYFKQVLRQQAIINAGIRFHLIDEASGESWDFVYPEGIKGHVEELLGTTGLTEPYYFTGEGRGRDRKDKEDYQVKAEICFAFSNDNPGIEYYHNSSWLEYGGSPDRAARSAFVAVLDSLAKEQNRYQAEESKISFRDIEDSLILVISSFSSFSSYENQTKKAINNRYIQAFLSDLIRENFHVWVIEHQKEALIILDQVLVNKRSRERAESQRRNLKKKLSGQIDNIYNRVDNFVDCRSKDVNRRELYIVEGNSALGSVKMARNAEFQAVIPLRGKILNCLKASYTQIFKNDIIMDLIKLLGCGIHLEGHSKLKDVPDFNIDNLRWDKIIICTDADVDGFQIRTLILAMFYRLTPQLIEEGKIHIVESPLFEISHQAGKDQKTYFAYSDREKNGLLDKLKTGKVHVQRSKGLGENEPEMMWITTMNPDTRRLYQVYPEDADSTFEMFDILLGNNLEGRKAYISEHGHRYMDMLDVV